LLGQFDLRLNGQPVELRSRPAQSFLAYLLLNAGTACRREKLSGILWPESTEANARNSLRQVLWRVHQALDLDHNYLLVDDFSVTFNPSEPYWLDVAILDHKGVEAGPLEELIAAVSVYEGELLPGFYEDWVSLERDRLQAVFEQKMKVLLDRLVTEQRWPEILDWGERWIAHGNTPEPAYQSLMVAHAALGDVSSVAAVFRRCTDALRELGVEPSDQTRALYERLTKGEIRGYELRQPVSTGEFGSLYRAYHRLVGREVAIKVLLPEYANQPDFIRRFDAEAQLIARVEHPHILPLYDYWREPDGAYIVMRWMRGGSLRLLLRKRPLSASNATRLVDQIAAALTAAHRQGLVHGHLKPENILFDEEGNAYLTHFGISSDVRRLRGDGLPAASKPLAYLAPEQAHGEPATPLSDQYSLGLIVAEVLTGRFPRDKLKAVAAGINSNAATTRERRPDLPSELDDVIQRATAPNPAERYSDVMAFVTAFHQVLGTGATSTNGKRDRSRVEISNPYKGLRAFQQADAPDFFGREALTEQLLARLRESQQAGRFLAVVGPSGSGKSSVVKAGLLPALRRGALPGSEKWFIVEISPGAHPLEELEIGLLRIAVNQPVGLMEQLRRDERGLLRATQLLLPADDSELLLVVDQFEHVFTRVDDDAEAAHFLNSLFTAVTDPASRLRVIITLRADFYDRPLLHPGFGNLLRQHTEVVMPLTADELECAIVGPAERVGVTLEPGLVAAIEADVNEQPSALPLLQYALTELFERREGRQLTRKAYQQVGGVGGALGRRAEEVYAGLDKAGQSATRQLFLRLVTLGEGVKDTRRRISQAELMSISFGAPVSTGKPAGQPHNGLSTDGSLSPALPHPASTLSWQAGVMETVIDAFGKSRLLSFDRDPGTRTPTVEVAHSALLREWRRLSDWLDASRVDRRLQHILATAAEEWLDAHQEASFLLQGARLAQFEGWAASTELALTEQEHAYLIASLAERQAQQVQETTRLQREQEAIRKLRLRNRVNAGIAVMAVVLALLAGYLWNKYMQQTHFAQSRQLAAQAMSHMSDQPDLAGLLSIEALNTYDTLEARSALITAQEQQPQLPLNLHSHKGSVRSVVFSPDGKTLASASTDGSVLFWDETAHPASGPSLAQADRVTALAFAPDGSRIASAAEEINVMPWHGATGQPTTLASQGVLVTSLAFSPDGKRLASGMADNSIILWDTATGQPIGQPLKGHTDWVYSVAFSPDGKRLASGSKDRSIILWDMATLQPIGKPLNGHTDWVYSVAFSPDGQKLASGSADNTIMQWDVATQKLVGHPFLGHAGYVFSVAFSPDGATIASGSEDGTIRLWDSSTNQAIGQPLSADTGAVYSVAFSPDGKRLASGGQDGTVSFWGMDWQSRVCKVVGRNLTQIEWKQYLPSNQLYRKTCPNWPEDNADTVNVSLYSSKSKEDWINAATAGFNAAQIKTASGKTVVVSVTQVNSGGSTQDILDGKIQPVVWSPGDQSWVDQANQSWQARTGQPLISEACAPTVYDPIGFAMWRPMAEAMGWPDQAIGWDRLAALAADPQGWAAYGHPEWGQFKFGHTLPDISNSGLLILTALAYDRLGLTSGLTPDLVKSDAVIGAMREVEQYTTVYAQQSEDLLALMAQRGPAYLQAVNTNEAEVLKTNAKYGNLLPLPLVFVFPAHGTFWAQHPYCILDAEWVTKEQREAARLYEDYLLAPEQQALAVDKGLRPADQAIPLHAPIALDNGTDPNVTPATVPSLLSPFSAVSNAIKEVFHMAERRDIPTLP
jgi:WD40 repeat protein/DNA-binding SARP family transcriptional activator